jgi:3-oxoacyl-[acyl-carrier-protein] synthase III
MGLPDSKVIKNIREYGNTTAATIPLALKTALDERKLKPATACCWPRSARASPSGRCS